MSSPRSSLPAAIRLREDELLEAVSAFYADRLFSPGRRGIIEADLATVDDSATQERRAERERLQRQLADVARRQDSVLRQAQDGAPDDPFAKALRQNYNKLGNDKSAVLAALAHLDAEDRMQPAKPTSADLNRLEGTRTSSSIWPRRLRRCLADSLKSPSSP
ncbi:hypothetical protein ACIA2T_00165 [Amycolatopsis japonica]|uniref:hypothetical protein n=1 Tax=Amycolatopsis japonica TaxID=208439 RepID=UPI0037967297